MATPLDTGLLSSFQPLFGLLFVFVIVYAVLAKTEILGKNKAVPVVIAVLLAVSALLSKVALKTMTLMAPWFVILFIFGIFVLVTFSLFGVKDDIITGLWKGAGGGPLFWWVLVIVILIGVGSLLTVLKEEKKAPMFLENETNATINGVSVEPQISFWHTLLNAKVLGAALVLLIALFAISNLTRETSS